MLRAVFSRATRSPRVARAIFGVRFCALGEGDYYFDVTTIALFQRLAQQLRPEARLLDMGTGAAAVLGLAVWRRVGCQVTSCDVNPELVASARRNVAFNAAPIDVRESRFFDGVGDDFDTVSFNPPYVPTSTGERLGDHGRRSQWDGGAAGTSVIEQYLDAAAQLRRPIVSYLGMNHRHVPREVMERVLAARPAHALLAAWRHRALPVDVYTITSDGAQSNSTSKTPSPP